MPSRVSLYPPWYRGFSDRDESMMTVSIFLPPEFESSTSTSMYSGNCFGSSSFSSSITSSAVNFTTSSISHGDPGFTPTSSSAMSSGKSSSLSFSDRASYGKGSSDTTFSFRSWPVNAALTFNTCAKFSGRITKVTVTSGVLSGGNSSIGPSGCGGSFVVPTAPSVAESCIVPVSATSDVSVPFRVDSTSLPSSPSASSYALVGKGSSFAKESSKPGVNDASGSSSAKPDSPSSSSKLFSRSKGGSEGSATPASSGESLIAPATARTCAARYGSFNFARKPRWRRV